MNTQHTSGPWWVDDNGFIASGSGDDYKTIADPRCMEPRGNEAEIDANADLIAAAPDLLDALHDLMDQLEGVGIAIEDQDSGQWHGAEGLSFAKARAAIAKAAQP
jgi:hypothetical protein